MARRSTIGHDPLKALNVAPTKRPAAQARPAAARAASAERKQAANGASAGSAKAPPPPRAAAPRADLPVSANEKRALEVVRRHLGWSTAAGLLPVPWLDLAAMVVVNMKMLREIATIYDQRFPPEVVKPLVSALVVDGAAFAVAGPTAYLLMRSVPVLGPIAGMLTLPALSAAACFAIGKVFIQHFESGGTFLDFEPSRVRAHYAREFAAARAAG